MRRSFSMIEMLGVIIVIMILAGLLFPTISSIIKQGNDTKTKAKIVTLQTAIMAYKSTYGYLPFTPSKSSDAQLTDAEYDVLLNCLTAESDAANPRKIRFLDKKEISYKDAWDRDFRVTLDLDYSGEITSTSTIPAEVAVSSAGSDESWGTDDDINSWDN